MKFNSILVMAGITLSLVLPAPVLAADDTDEAFNKRVALSKKIKSMKELRREMPIPPAAGLFGIYHLPKPGEFVAGINFHHHKFDGLLDGDNSISSAEAVATAPNIFFGAPGQPPTLRVVPKRAEAYVAYPFINYTVDENFSLVALAQYLDQETVLETFNGPGTASIGTSTVTAKGLGDIKFGVLYTPYKSYNDKGVRKHNFIIDAVLSAPTGDIEQDDYILTPAGTRMKSRLAYGMQLGSGTWDALLGLAYWGKEDKWGWGAQYLATIPLENENDEGWRYGDKHELTTWLSYEWKPTLVSSLRLRHETQDEIEGMDPKIFGPGLGANPDNYGGTKTELAIGVNWMYSPGHNLSMEYSEPVSQNRNGVQADHEQSLMFSWRNVFF
jgi:hypothetical protein